MYFSRSGLARIVIALASSLAAASARQAPARPGAQPADYKGAIVMDAASGEVLFESGADIVNPPASMTKLMTFAVLRDKLATGELALGTPIRITPADARMGGTQVFLDPRETFSVEELLYAMMVQSANDAAHALARAAAGSVPAFVDLMNVKARQLGMQNTTFRTPHGLPPASRRIREGDLSTPRDFALLSRHLLLATDVLTYSSIRMRPFGEGVRREPMMMVNHNKLLEKVAGVDGLKTGYTAGAGFCLAATAQREGRRIIVVVMGSSQSKLRDLEVMRLLDRGFATRPATVPVIDMTKTPPASAPETPAPAAPPERADAEPKVYFTLPKR